LKALGEAAKNRSVKPAERRDALCAFIKTATGKSQLEGVQLAGDWKLESAATDLVALGKDAKPQLRDAVFESLRKIGGDKAIGAIRALATDGQTLATRRAAITTW